MWPQVDFTHIFRDYLTGIGTISQSSQFQWSSTVECGDTSLLNLQKTCYVPTTALSAIKKCVCFTGHIIYSELLFWDDLPVPANNWAPHLANYGWITSTCIDLHVVVLKRDVGCAPTTHPHPTYARNHFHLRRFKSCSLFDNLISMLRNCTHRELFQWQ